LLILIAGVLPMVSSTLPKSRPLPVVLRIASRDSMKNS
jgi:hypothetical protein